MVNVTVIYSHVTSSSLFYNYTLYIKSIPNYFLNNNCASLRTLFSVLLQFLLVLLAGMLLPDQTLSKPRKLRELEQRDQNITERQLEASQAVNGTSGIREKRDLSDCPGFLKNYCGPVTAYSSPGNHCEIGRYVCRGHHEAVCKRVTWASSTACNSNIRQHGRPRCSAHFKKVKINTSQGTICVWQTEYCSC